MPKLLVWRWTRERVYRARLRELLASREVVILTQAHVDYVFSLRLIRAAPSGALSRELLASVLKLFEFATGVVDEGRCLIVRRESLCGCAVVVIWAPFESRCAVVAVMAEEFPLDDDFAADAVLFENEIRHRRELAASETGGAP